VQFLDDELFDVEAAEPCTDCLVEQQEILGIALVPLGVVFILNRFGVTFR
jgi:hypothetical protein